MNEKISQKKREIKEGDFSMIRTKVGRETTAATRSKVFSGDTKIAESVKRSLKTDGKVVNENLSSSKKAEGTQKDESSVLLKNNAKEIRSKMREASKNGDEAGYNKLGIELSSLYPGAEKATMQKKERDSEKKEEIKNEFQGLRTEYKNIKQEIKELKEEQQKSSFFGLGQFFNNSDKELRGLEERLLEVSEKRRINRMEALSNKDNIFSYFSKHKRREDLIKSGNIEKKDGIFKEVGFMKNMVEKIPDPIKKVLSKFSGLSTTKKAVIMTGIGALLGLIAGPGMWAIKGARAGLSVFTGTWARNKIKEGSEIKRRNIKESTKHKINLLSKDSKISPEVLELLNKNYNEISSVEKSESRKKLAYALAFGGATWFGTGIVEDFVTENIIKDVVADNIDSSEYMINEQVSNNFEEDTIKLEADKSIGDIEEVLEDKENTGDLDNPNIISEQALDSELIESKTGDSYKDIEFPQGENIVIKDNLTSSIKDFLVDKENGLGLEFKDGDEFRLMNLTSNIINRIENNTDFGISNADKVLNGDTIDKNKLMEIINQKFTNLENGAEYDDLVERSRALTNNQISNIKNVVEGLKTGNIPIDQGVEGGSFPEGTVEYNPQNIKSEGFPEGTAEYGLQGIENDSFPEGTGEYNPQGAESIKSEDFPKETTGYNPQDMESIKSEDFPEGTAEYNSHGIENESFPKRTEGYEIQDNFNDLNSEWDDEKEGLDYDEFNRPVDFEIINNIFSEETIKSINNIDKNIIATASGNGSMMIRNFESGDIFYIENNDDKINIFDISDDIRDVEKIVDTAKAKGLTSAEGLIDKKSLTGIDFGQNFNEKVASFSKDDISGIKKAMDNIVRNIR